MSDSSNGSSSTPESTSKPRMKSIFSSSQSETKAEEKSKWAPKPAWMDASLSDKERWKKWEKERDQQFYGRGGTAGYFSSYYKSSKVWWIGVFGSWAT
ncbi:hypothetical protein SLS58_006389 [Diplodia intermedia]|uniref:Uncharacterized protein n=1 Tax=Diplodia intermedia TaxID=856260 RepID=A0ABR3TN83_9PEZI